MLNLSNYLMEAESFRYKLVYQRAYLGNLCGKPLIENFPPSLKLTKIYTVVKLRKLKIIHN